MDRRPSRRAVMTGTAAVAAVGMTGCLQNPDPSRGGGGGGTEKYTEGDVPGPGTVSVLGAFGGQEEEAFMASLASFEEETGVTVQ